MTAYKKILVAVDVFDNYQAILEKALSVSDKDAALQLIYVIEPIFLGSEYTVDAIDGLQQQAQKMAEKVFAEIREEFGITAENCFIEFGKPSHRIHDIAEKTASDLIVIGSHGRHGIQLLLGSTANAVLHGASCDVLSVRIDGQTIDA